MSPPSRFARGSVGLGVAMAVFTCAVAPLALADVKEDCTTAAERSQPLRRDGHLKASREQLLVCAREECPRFVRMDCTQWLTQLDSFMPSVVIRAQDASGTDVVDVRISLDGAPLTSALDGREIPVDPGTHTLVFERDGSAPVQQTVVVREGEQRRMLSATFANPLPQAAPAPFPAVAPPDAPAHRSLLLPIALFSGAAVGVGVASYFWQAGLSERSTMQSTCAATHSCAASSVGSARDKLVAGDVLAGLSVVAAGAGVWSLVSGTSAAPRATGVTGRVTPGGAVLGVDGSF